MAERQISDAEALALSGAIVGPGAQMPTDDVADWDLQIWRAQRRLADALLAAAGLEVVKDDTGVLKVYVRAGRVANGNTEYAFAALANQAVAANQTNYVYVTAANLAAGTVTINTTGFPNPEATPHIPLATVVCGATDFDYDDITDYRGQAILKLVSGLTAAQANSLRAMVSPATEGLPWSAAAFGTWAVDGDGANTHGGGLVGDVTLTALASAYSKVYGQSLDDYANLASSSSLADWTANYQVHADAGSDPNDAFYVGHSIPFCEVAFDLSQVATYSGDCGLWEYWTGAAWAAATVIDHTDTTAGDGKRPLQQSGALHWVPAADWAACAVDGQSAYWLRWRCTSAAVTQVAILDAKNPEIVTPADGPKAPFDGTITDLRCSDATAGTLHTTADVKFVLVNFTTGLHSGELTWAQDKRSDSWTGLSLAVSAGDSLGIVVTQEDGANEVANAMLEMIVVPTA